MIVDNNTLPWIRTRNWSVHVTSLVEACSINSGVRTEYIFRIFKSNQFLSFPKISLFRRQCNTVSTYKIWSLLPHLSSPQKVIPAPRPNLHPTESHPDQICTPQKVIPACLHPDQTCIPQKVTPTKRLCERQMNNLCQDLLFSGRLKLWMYFRAAT